MSAKKDDGAAALDALARVLAPRVAELLREQGGLPPEADPLDEVLASVGWERDARNDAVGESAPSARKAGAK
ncbi:MAG: hypothetical protein QM756_24025 [Polyangiaceae bacterium]